MKFEQVWTGFCRSGRGAVLLFAGVIALAACQSTGPSTRPAIPSPPPTQRPTPLPGAVPEPQTQPDEPIGPSGLVPPHMEGRTLIRIGLLLPFSAKSTALRTEARSMLSAAQMAIFEARDPRLVLLPKDTAGTAPGAQSAASAVIMEGADIILGPVLGRAVSAATPPAYRAGIPMIAFSTDRSVAGNGVYLLSFLPESDVKRMLDFISKRNQGMFNAFTTLRNNTETVTPDKTIRTLALLRPDNRYGDRIEDALFTQTAKTGLFVSDIARYGRDTQSMSAPARQIAHVDERNEAIAIWKKAGGFGDPGLDPAFAFALPYQAIFIPESGVRLRSLAPLLPFYDVDPKITKFIGTSLWNDEELWREPALFGGWFPAPNARDRTLFSENYQLNFDEKPSRLASLAHDGVFIVPMIVSVRRGGLAIDQGKIENRKGFHGADGLFRFGADGLVERALSVFEIRQGEFREIDAAPEQFETPDEDADTPAF